MPVSFEAISPFLCKNDQQPTRDRVAASSRVAHEILCQLCKDEGHKIIDISNALHRQQ